MVFPHGAWKRRSGGGALDEFIRKVYERGKITIPKELRDFYGVHDGDLVKLRIVKVIQAMEEGRQVDGKEVEVTACFEDPAGPRGQSGHGLGIGLEASEKNVRSDRLVEVGRAYMAIASIGSGGCGPSAPVRGFLMESRWPIFSRPHALAYMVEGIRGLSSGGLPPRWCQ